MMDAWHFWREQLAGKAPETTPGTPHAGYFLSRRRVTKDNPNPTIGGPRKKVETYHDPVAIWHDGESWHCLITRVDGPPRYLTNVDAIDDVFSRCCRSALTYEAYIALVPEQEQVA
jgi:hypothetical protein